MMHGVTKRIMFESHLKYVCLRVYVLDLEHAVLCHSFGLCLGELLAAIERDFGSFDNFKTQMTAKTVAIQGSGWGWLVQWASPVSHIC